MDPYTADLTHAKHEALKVLLDLLRACDDPLEKRRLATAILRIPTPRPPSPAKREKVAESARPDEGQSSAAQSAIRNQQSQIPAVPRSLPSSPSHPIIAHILNAVIASKAPTIPTIAQFNPHTFNPKDPP